MKNQSKIYQSKTVANIYQLARSNLTGLCLIFGMVSLVSLLEAICIGCIFPIVSAIQEPEKFNSYVEKINSVLPFNLGLSLSVTFLLIGVIIVFIVKNTALVLATYLQARFGERLKAKWKNRIFEIYLSQPLSFFFK